MDTLGQLTDFDIKRIFLDIALADQILSEYDVKLERRLARESKAAKSQFHKTISEARKHLSRAATILENAGCIRDFVSARNLDVREA